jgi:hypothetical protein
MEKNSRLRHIGLPQILIRSFKHQISDAKMSGFHWPFQTWLWLRAELSYKSLTHAYKLCSLSRKYKRFLHNINDLISELETK